MNGRISTGLNLVPLAPSRSKGGRRLMLASWIAWLFLVTPATLYAEKLRVSVDIMSTREPLVKKLRAEDRFNLAYLTKLDQSGFIDQLYAAR
jgi:hypothetical protein